MGTGQFYFLPQEHVLFGPGSLSGLAQEVERLGGSKVLIITGHSLNTQTDVIQKVKAGLAGYYVGTFAAIKEHAPRSGVEQAAAAVREYAADLLVSVGGGSPIDTAKAVKLLLGAETIPLKHIAIPTTLGAAEFSHLAGITDDATHTKGGLAKAELVPNSVILDANLTLATPPQLWLSSGIRALDHAVETLYAPGQHPISDVLALEAVRQLFEFLPRSYHNPREVEVRAELQLAAWMSFFGEVNTPMGLSHNLGRGIGASYNVPHGLTSCITLAPVMRFMAATPAVKAIARVADALNLGVDSDDQSKAFLAAEAVAGLVVQLGLPQRLREVGLKEADLPAIAQSLIAQAKARRVPLPENQIEALLAQMW